MLRRRILELEWGAPLNQVRPVDLGLAALLHGPRLAREIFLCWRRRSDACARGFGVSRRRQLATLVYTTFRYNFDPALYYRARLFRLPRARWSEVFSHEEVMQVLAVMERRTAALGIWSKRGWAEFCGRHHLPQVPTLASVVAGVFYPLDPEALDRGMDLFVKPDRGWASRGTLLLEWQPGRAGWQAVGAREEFVPRTELAAFLIEVSGGADLMVQPRLRTHPDLADLATRALVNVRVVTVRAPDGAISVFSAALRIPGHAEHCSDVLNGYFVPVALGDGTLGHAEGLDLTPGPLTVHPVTGAPILGRRIAQWAEMRRQALAAHALLPSLPSVGWDLVPAESGVLVLEANVTWSTNLTQLRGLAPLGESEWPASVLAYLDETAGDQV